MPITKYAGPSKKFPFDISDIGGIGTAFEIHIEDSVIRRGIVLSTNAPDCMWFAKLSVARTNGESQDLRSIVRRHPGTSQERLCSSLHFNGRCIIRELGSHRSTTCA